ncbi:MAG: DUF4365 domain-containing protein [Ruminococcaceae bacterium]|nr:DUF4365 domain-containing protein [Oscillospiraceae bacterium]
MEKNLIASHSNVAFDESKAVTFLKETLESQKSIKTFFGENDKTPNHDGFFELVDEKLVPRKQFIVQIKKTNELVPKAKGKNNGKYVYRLKTNFLEYVKQKVTESPAIYFIVDIEEKRIFWLYLSDEVLMNMDFESHRTISYAFSEQNILSDISSFTTELKNIVMQRNKLFLNKTEEEITEMQDAADYINQLLDHDLKLIKESVFPNLWRLGIKCSDSPGVSIGFGDGIGSIPCSSAVAFYPQIKGKCDSGIHEYLMDNDNIFNHFSFIGKINLLEYAKDSLHNIIKLFFEHRIPPCFLPDIVLFEVIDSFIQKSNNFFVSSCHELSVEEVSRRLMLLVKYVEYILDSPSINKTEEQIKNTITRRLNMGSRSFFDITNFPFSNNQLIQSFQEFCANNNCKISFSSPKVFMCISAENLYYFNIIGELKNRNIDKVSSVWEYNWIDLCKMSNDEYAKTARTIFNRWITLLTSSYEETYDNIFSSNNYKVKNRYVFNTKQKYVSSDFSNIFYVCKQYSDKSFSVFYDETMEENLEFDDKEPNLKNISGGINFNMIFKSNIPLFYSISSLLYKGICEELGLSYSNVNFF